MVGSVAICGVSLYPCWRTSQMAKNTNLTYRTSANRTFARFGPTSYEGLLFSLSFPLSLSLSHSSYGWPLGMVVPTARSRFLGSWVNGQMPDA